MVNKAAAKLRAQLAEQGKVIVCPGVQDGLSARVCLNEGFENLYMVCMIHTSRLVQHSTHPKRNLTWTHPLNNIFFFFFRRPELVQPYPSSVCPTLVSPQSMIWSAMQA